MKIYTGKTVEEVLATVCEEQGVTEDKIYWEYESRYETRSN